MPRRLTVGSENPHTHTEEVNAYWFRYSAEWKNSELSMESFSSQEGAWLIPKDSPLHVGHRTAKEPQIHLDKYQWI